VSRANPTAFSRSVINRPSWDFVFLTQNYPRFIGLTGSVEAVEAAKRQFRVFAEKNPDPNDPEGYVVPHSAITYVLGPDGKFVTHFTDAVEASAMARALEQLL
jgi:protein SCO1/2